jgi:hypothetical protein
MEPRATNDELLGGCWRTSWPDPEDETDPAQLEQELQVLLAELVDSLVD